MTTLIYTGILAFLLFNFQNCSRLVSSSGELSNRTIASQNLSLLPKSEGELSGNASTESAATAHIIDQSNSNGDSAGSNTVNSQISDRDCYFNYVSIFKWENANDSNAFEVAPVTSLLKVTTLKIYNSSNHSQLNAILNYFPDTAWKYYFILSPGTTPGSTMVTSYLNKKDSSDFSTEMTCGFGPTFDENSKIIDPGARIVYQNVGVGLNGIDGQSGFLSHKDKFIACKFTKGSQGILLYGETSYQTMHSPFVIKRGCYNSF